MTNDHLNEPPQGRDEQRPRSPSEESTVPPYAASTDPQQIRHYKILRKIGEGGMGVVYEAEQEGPVRRKVALKLIKWGMDSKQVIARFEAERQALALMSHPNIAAVFDAGATEVGRPYFAMEYIKGVSITEYCDTHRLTVKARLELFVQVCQGVQHAHQRGIVHRDLKPSNVLIEIKDDKPIPKIIDFGVAKATNYRLTEKTVFTEYGQIIGTPEYMSPEQAEMSALDVDGRTDVYSLGVILYELLAGALPFDADRLRQAAFGQIQRIIREEDPPTPSARISGLGTASAEVSRRRQTDVRALRRNLRGDLDWIVMKALRKDRTSRYASATELARDLTRYLCDERVVAGLAWFWSLRWSGLPSALALALIPGITGILCAHWPLTEGLERRGLDFLFLMRGPLPTPQDVCVVGIDADSYHVLGVDPAGPWPRRLHADLIRTLAREGARAVAFDVLFEVARDPEEDRALKNALRDTKIVVLGSTVEQVENPRFRQARLVDPYGPFAAAATAVGKVNLPSDRDGVVRSAWLFHEDRPTLALAAYEVATGDRSLRSRAERLVDYYGPAPSTTTVGTTGRSGILTLSLYQVLDSGKYLPPGFFRGKIVFVGLSQAETGPAGKDAFLTPFRGARGNLTYGVEIHATVTANLLEGRRIDPLPSVLEGVMLLLLPLPLTLILFYARPVVGAFALVALEILTWAAAYLAFAHAGVWIPVIIPAVVQLPVAYIESLIRMFFLRKSLV